MCFCLLLIDKARAKDNECRCDERLKTKPDQGIYVSHIHWVVRGTGTPEDRDEVNRRDVCECDG